MTELEELKEIPAPITGHNVIVTHEVFNAIVTVLNNTVRTVNDINTRLEVLDGRCQEFNTQYENDVTNIRESISDLGSTIQALAKSLQNL